MSFTEFNVNSEDDWLRLSVAYFDLLSGAVGTRKLFETLYNFFKCKPVGHLIFVFIMLLLEGPSSNTKLESKNILDKKKVNSYH